MKKSERNKRTKKSIKIKGHTDCTFMRNVEKRKTRFSRGKSGAKQRQRQRKPEKGGKR